MQYIEITFTGIDQEAQELFIAQLSELGYEGFEQSAEALLAYISEAAFEEQALKDIAGDVAYSLQVIPRQNWNTAWESNFQPVIVEDFCTIRADFHKLDIDTKHEIVITPKMSFGTGHHATTQLMMLMMRDIDFAGKRVLDFGTGTGVLAILAEQLGADAVLGIDNDEWSVENAGENIVRNNCKKIIIQLNNEDLLPSGYSDIILANINRHILLAHMARMYELTTPGGTVLLSGLLTADRDVITASAVEQGLEAFGFQELNGWITLAFKKPL